MKDVLRYVQEPVSEERLHFFAPKADRQTYRGVGKPILILTQATRGRNGRLPDTT